MTVAPASLCRRPPRRRCRWPWLLAVWLAVPLWSATLCADPAPSAATAALAAAVALPCAATADGEDLGAASALLVDVRLLVAVRSQRGWEIDRSEREAALPAALASVCRATPAARTAAVAAARQAREAAGGPVEAAMAQHHGDLDQVAPLLQAERVLDLLQLAVARSGEDCPRWLRPQRRFAGHQTVAGRSFLHLDGGGLVTARHSSAGLNFGGGGSGRALVGYGLSGRWAILSGAELGGAALIDPATADNRLRLHWYGAWPWVARRSWQHWHLDADVAAVVQSGPDLRVRGVGVRAGLMLRLSTGRLLDTLPLAGAGVTFEQMLAGEAGSAGEWTVRAGFRVGFDWDWGAKSRDRAAWQAQP